ncbi:hypothetical protein Poly41_12710 [Novipirellula artificiosorum]|uniref:Uncharacterized protein n=1 Tax=Novipirellula artificiosorum TaxID=2528016 RepID=A0A5C6DUV2_9BACT|nr:hypothetical protein Poly41_12710 [Novipirellula artificiosorum]
MNQGDIRPKGGSHPKPRGLLVADIGREQRFRSD